MRGCRGALTLLLLLAMFFRRGGQAMEEIETEEDIADLLPQHMGAEEVTAEKRQWAVLPQFGYSPDAGPLMGVKFTHRNLVGSGVTFDLNATYSLNQHQDLSLGLGQPHLLDDRFLVVLRLTYANDPQRAFFGLGNNDQGPDPASTNLFQHIFGTLTFGWRPIRRVAVNFTLGLRHVAIRNGDRLDRCGDLSPCPFTPEAFPDLPGVDGGMASRLGVSFVWNGRDSDDVVRPTRGWRAILKAIHANKSLASDFEFTRYIVDLGYLYPFGGGRYIFGLRTDGEYIDAPSGEVPFWELAELGGQDTMRGFFPHRFLGKGRLLVNAELRFLIADFNFFDLWQVKIDGVTFGDGGRVFIDHSDLKDEFKLNSQLLDRIFSDFQYSYGGGVRIALGKALVARIDVGFSNEEQGLVYLSFGQTF